MSVGEKIKQFRVKKGMTRRTLAIAVDSTSYLSKRDARRLEECTGQCYFMINGNNDYVF
jgi:hypothetical protein